MTPRVGFLMDLWKKLQIFPGCLPDPGGLLDQEEKLMRELGWIQERITSREDQQSRSKGPHDGSGLIGPDGNPIGGRR